MTKATKQECLCDRWVTGGMAFEIQRDAEDDRVTAFRIRGSWPARTAISRTFAGRLAEDIKVPGAAIWEGSRLVIRTTDGTEVAYEKIGSCPGCGYVWVERA